jgi:hypothetical protein
LIWKLEIDTKANEGMMWMRWVKPLVCRALPDADWPFLLAWSVWSVFAGLLFSLRVWLDFYTGMAWLKALQCMRHGSSIRKI